MQAGVLPAACQPVPGRRGSHLGSSWDKADAVGAQPEAQSAERVRKVDPQLATAFITDRAAGNELTSAGKLGKQVFR